MRVSLCAIIRDCGGPLVRCLRSLLECDGGPAVDELCIVDTGSTDSTLDDLHAYHRYVSRTLAAPVPLRVEQVTPASEPTWYAPGGLCCICHGHGRDKGPGTPPCSRCGGSGIYHADGPPLLTRYGDARTRAFAMATQSWTLWLDSDDVCEGWGGLQGALATVPAEVGALVCPYHYDYSPDGRVLSIIPRTRLVRRGAGYTLRGRYHEDLAPPDGPTTVATVDDLVVQHRRRGEPNKGRLHAVLGQIEREEGGLDARLSGYAVQHHIGQDRPHDALPYAERALSLAATPKERLDGTLALASVHLALGDVAAALAGFEAADVLDPADIDAAFGAFAACAMLKRHGDALAWWEKAQARPGPPRTLSLDEVAALGKLADGLAALVSRNGLPSLSPAGLALGRGVPVTSETPLRATASAPRCTGPGCGKWVGHAGRCGPMPRR